MRYPCNYGDVPHQDCQADSGRTIATVVDLGIGNRAVGGDLLQHVGDIGTPGLLEGLGKNKYSVKNTWCLVLECRNGMAWPLQGKISGFMILL